MLKGVCVVMFWCFEQGRLMQGIATRSYVTLYIITSRLSMRRWSKGRQFRSFNIAVTLEVYL